VVNLLVVAARSLAAASPPAPSTSPAGSPGRSLRPARLRRATRPVVQMHSKSSGWTCSRCVRSITRSGRRSAHGEARARKRRDGGTRGGVREGRPSDEENGTTWAVQRQTRRGPVRW